MFAIALLLVRMLCDCFRPRPRLEAEILILRHQLNVLQQRTPRRRLHLRWIDRALFIWLYHRYPRILDAVPSQNPAHVTPQPREFHLLTFICPRPGKECCGMRWRQSRARLSREKLLHLVESFLKSTHVILRKNERNNTLLGGTDDKLDPGPSTYREMRDVRRFRLRHGADDFPGVRLRLHRLRPEVD